MLNITCFFLLILLLGFVGLARHLNKEGRLVIGESQSNKSTVKICFPNVPTPLSMQRKGNNLICLTEMKNVRIDFEISKDELKSVQKVKGSRNFDVLSAEVILLAAIEYAYYIVQIGKDLAEDPTKTTDRLNKEMLIYLRCQKLWKA